MNKFKKTKQFEYFYAGFIDVRYFKISNTPRKPTLSLFQ